MRRVGTLLAVVIASVCGSPVEPDDRELVLTAEAADSLRRGGPVEEDEDETCWRPGAAQGPTEPCPSPDPQRDGAGQGPDAPGHLPHPVTAQHEPEGFSAIAAITFADSINAAIGECTFPLGQNGNQTFEQDVTAPSGDSAVYRLRFPRGLHDGSSPGRFDCWGPVIGVTRFHDYQQIYVSYWLKIEGSDYENQSVGTKMLYVAHGTSERHNDSYLMLDGCSRQCIQTDLRPRIRLSTIDENDEDTSGISQTPSLSSVRLPVGEWAHIEMLFKANDIRPAVANGTFDLWVNGTHTTAVTGWRFRSNAARRDNAFYHLQFTPIYGGNAGDVRTRDDYWRLDGLYISAR